MSEGAELVIVDSYASCKEAIGRAEMCLSEGRRMIFLVPRPRLFEFLSRLDSPMVEVRALPTLDGASIKHPHSLCRMTVQLRAVRSVLKKLPPVERAYCFSIGFDLAPMMAVSYFSKRTNVFYSSYDGYFLEQEHYQLVHNLSSRAGAFLMSLLTRIPLVACRPRRPILRLPDQFIKGRLNIVTASEREKVLEAWENGGLRNSVAQSSSADVLWLYSDLPAYYDIDAKDASNIERTWEGIVGHVTSVIPRAQHAVKSHPMDAGPLPACFHGMEELPREVPLEFFAFRQVRLVIGVPSQAMLTFVPHPEISIISLNRLFHLPRQAQEHQEEFLTEWLNVSGRIHSPSSFSEFENIMSSLPK